MGHNKKQSYKKAHNAHKHKLKGKSNHAKGETHVNTNSSVDRPSISNKNSSLERESKTEYDDQNGQ